ncbi:MAG: hypothetical protein GY711_02580 [bacterium]|nr:hypothetical protein [bacterium]
MNAPRAEKPTRARRPSRWTCLYCYHPFRVERSSEHCPACDELNLRVDQETFWTREPALVRVETILKAAIVLAIGSLTALMLVTISGGGMGQGWAIAFPILAGWILWETAGLVTRRRTTLDMRLLWPVVFVCVGLGPTLFLLATGLSVSFGNPAELLGVGLLCTLLCLIPAWLCMCWARCFVRFREGRIARGARCGPAAAPVDGVS